VHLPHSQYIVATSVALIAMMLVYIVSTCAALHTLYTAPAAEAQYGALEYGTEVTL
jgi:hypothetical protein